MQYGAMALVLCDPKNLFTIFQKSPEACAVFGHDVEVSASPQLPLVGIARGWGRSKEGTLTQPPNIITTAIAYPTG